MVRSGSPNITCSNSSVPSLYNRATGEYLLFIYFTFFFLFLLCFFSFEFIATKFLLPPQYSRHQFGTTLCGCQSPLKSPTPPFSRHNFLGGDGHPSYVAHILILVSLVSLVFLVSLIIFYTSMGRIIDF